MPSAGSTGLRTGRQHQVNWLSERTCLMFGSTGPRGCLFGINSRSTGPYIMRSAGQRDPSTPPTPIEYCNTTLPNLEALSSPPPPPRSIWGQLVEPVSLRGTWDFFTSTPSPSFLSKIFQLSFITPLPLSNPLERHLYALSLKGKNGEDQTTVGLTLSSS